MEKLQEISNYVGNMKIRKTFFGGYDREDVFVKMQELVNMFQECIEEEQDKQKKLVEDYEIRIQTSQRMLIEINKRIAELSLEQKNAEAEKEKMIREAEGQAEAIMKVQQANADGIRFLKEAGADQAVLTIKSLEAFERAADGKATKIIIPSELQGIAGLAKSVVEVAKED